jgi:hypothetical protein
VLGPLLGIIKLVLLLPILLIWFSLIWILVTVFGCPFNVVRVFDIIFGRVALGLMGFWWTNSMKRMIIRPAIAALARPESFSLHSEKSSQPSDSVQPGDWIIANLTSYCDLIWYWFKYSGVVIISTDFEGGKLVPCSSRFYAIYHFFIKKEAGQNNRSQDSDSFTNNMNFYSKMPLIIFPECASSNGRGVLKFIANLSNAKRNQRIHLTCTKFHSDLFNPSFVGPPGLISFFSHLIQLCSQLQNTLTARTILPAALFSSNFDLPPATETLQYNRTLQQIIAALGHLRPLNLDVKDKISFLKSFE